MQDQARSIMAMFQIIGTRRIEPFVRGLLEQMLPTTHSPDRRAAPRGLERAGSAPSSSRTRARLRRRPLRVRDADAVGLFDIVWLERCPTLAPLRARCADFAADPAQRRRARGAYPLRAWLADDLASSRSGRRPAHTAIDAAASLHPIGDEREEALSQLIGFSSVGFGIFERGSRERLG